LKFKTTLADLMLAYIEEINELGKRFELDKLPLNEQSSILSIMEKVDKDSIDVLSLIEVLSQPDIIGEVTEKLVSDFPKLKKLINPITMLKMISGKFEDYATEKNISIESASAEDFLCYLEGKLHESSEKVPLESYRIKLQEMKNNIKNGLNKSYVTSCFTSNLLSNYMWQNYATGKNGYAIELDFSIEPMSFYEEYTFLKVQYLDEPITLDLDLLSKLKKDPTSVDLQLRFLYHASEILSTKHTDYSREEEIRLVTDKSRMQNRRYLMDISKYIRAVYFHIDANSNEVKKAIKTCEKIGIEIKFVRDEINGYGVEIL